MIRSATVTFKKTIVVFLVDEATHERVADLYHESLLQPLRIDDTEDALALARRIDGRT